MQRSSIILALDLATVLGWAVGPASLEREAIRYGSVALKSPHPGGGPIFAGFSNWLCDMVLEERPAVLAIEAPFVRPGMTFIRQARRAFGMAAIAETVAWRFETAFVEIAAPSVRKAFLGNGRAEKHEIIAECRRLGFDPQDDNAADALALLHAVPPRIESNEAPAQ